MSSACGETGLSIINLPKYSCFFVCAPRPAVKPYQKMTVVIIKPIIVLVIVSLPKACTDDEV